MLSAHVGTRPILRRICSRRGNTVALRSAGLHTSHRLSAKKRTQKLFKLADIGEGITECEVLKWNVKQSAKVEHFDQLCEVQSDKASVEITSPFDGVISQIHVQEGQIAKVGEGLCTIEIEEEEEDHPVMEKSRLAAPEATVASHLVSKPVSKASEGSVHSAPVLAASTSEPKAARRRHPLDPSPTEARDAAQTDGHDADTKTLATPSVRHFAREKGVPRLSQLWPGSGKNGRIEKNDVEAWLSSSSEPTASPKRESTSMKQDEASAAAGVENTVELGRTRWAMWRAMEQSLKIPHFGYSTILDLTALHELLPVLNANIPPEFNPVPEPAYPPAVSPYSILPDGQSFVTTDKNNHYTRMTVLPLLLKALSRAMQEWPLFRSSISQTNPDASPSDKPSLIIRPNSDMAIALSTPTGLYTPTIQSVNNKTAYEIMGELRRLSSLGRTVPNGLTLKEMPRKGATITVSNVGAIGKGEFAAPLLVPGGGVAIVAIGRAKWVQRDVGRRLEVGVSWSADHRVVEGAEMAAFTETWRGWVEEPGRMVAAGR
ncbi:hypothetical protein FRB97_000891 [Tulasnella sp. 331]|nr:hypothetical protein FRB97_000891 [Tulasnella sp. 331]